MSKIDSLVATFVSDLRRAIAAEAAAAFASVARSSGQEIGNGRRGRTPSPQFRRAAKSPKKARGGKRTSEEVLAQAKTLLAAIKKAPGSNIETLAKAVNISTKELALPALKLWEEKSIKVTGQRRGTKYFPK